MSPYKVLLLIALCLASPPAQAAGFRFMDVPADSDGPALKGAIWYPCAAPPGEVDLGKIMLPGVKDCPLLGDQLPLIVVSHGRGSSFVMHHDTDEVLADAGLIVVAVNHPGDTAFDLSHSGELSVMVERPTDIRRAIDFMLGGSPVAASIDPERSGFFGFSRGVFGSKTTPPVAGLWPVLPPTGPLRRKCIESGRSSVSIPVIQQAKIQAQVLIPLIKALQAELGEERANSLVRGALGDLYRRFGEEFAQSKSADNLGDTMASAFATYARDDALEYRVIEQSPDGFAIDVTGCRYAEFYKELGEPELGFLLVCCADFSVAEGVGPDVTLTRTQTIMQGASRCDFRYRRSSAAE